MTKGGMAEPQVKAHRKSKNGPQAWIEIKLWFSGQNGLNCLRVATYGKLENLQYTGKGGMTLQKVLNAFKLNYSTLEKAEEPVAKTAQCTAIFTAMQAPHLATALDIAKSNTTYMSDPDELSRYLMIYARDESNKQKRKRVISKVETTATNPGKAKKPSTGPADKDKPQFRKSLKNETLSKMEPEDFCPFKRIPNSVFAMWTTEQKTRKINRGKKANEMLDDHVIRYCKGMTSGPKYERVKSDVSKIFMLKDKTAKKKKAASIKASKKTPIDQNDTDEETAAPQEETAAGTQFGRKKQAKTD